MILIFKSSVLHLKTADLAIFLKNVLKPGWKQENGKGYYQPPDIQIQSNKDEETKAGYASVTEFS